IQSRIPRVVFGAYDPKGGCMGSCTNLLEVKGFNHYPTIEGGILQEECASLLKAFFRQKRKK
uniref:deaminase n=1 Tax=uncultured Faecalicoccus sp. TaxID=1971760 RepID=UPI003459347E